MAVVCAACGTENRDAAKFCRGCGARLNATGEATQRPESWAQTQPVGLEDPIEERTVLVSPAVQARTSPAVASAPPSKPALASASPAPGAGHFKRWLGIAAVLLVLLVGGLLWVGSGPRKGVASAPAAPVAVVPAPPVPTPAPEPAVPPAPSAPTAPDLGPLPTPMAVPDTPTEAALAAATPAPVVPTAPRPRPRRETAAEPAPAAAPAQFPVPAPVAPAAPAPPAAPAAASGPQQACANLGFIARARCMTAECAKPSLARHPQCEAVRQQQLLEDRIRNPDGGA